MVKAARITAFLLTALGVCITPEAAFSQGSYAADYNAARQWYGMRQYYLHPYYYSYGPRHDPHWSYNSSYTPYQYHNDGSYYGLGYSGYGGDGWYGSYWYW